MQCPASTLADNPSSSNDSIHSNSTTETFVTDNDTNSNVTDEEDEEYFIFTGRGADDVIGVILFSYT
jgi:hypothetical protein